MPTVTPQDRPQAAVSEQEFRSPKRTIQASTSTGMGGVLERIASRSDPKEHKEDKGDTIAPKPAVTLSPQLVALAKKEQEFVKRQQEFKAQQDALTLDRAEISELKDLKAKLANKDYSALEKLVPYEEYVNYVLNKAEAINPTDEKLNKVEQELSDLKKAQDDNLNRQFEATKSQFRKAITQHIQTTPEQFEAIAAQKAEEHVLTHILDTFNEDGVELTVEQACKEVEEAMIEDAIETAERLSKIGKVKAKFTPQEEPKKQLAPPKLRTLTNDTAGAAPIAAPRGQFQHLTMKERIAQAVARSQSNKG